MLNEAVKESYQKKAFLAREKRRLYDAQPTSSPDVHKWVDEEATRIFLLLYERKVTDTGEQVS